jgi:hypothetical protein
MTNSPSINRFGSPQPTVSPLLSVEGVGITSTVSAPSDAVRAQASAALSPRKRTSPASATDPGIAPPTKRVRLSIADLVNPHDELPGSEQLPPPAASITPPKAVFQRMTVSRDELCKKLDVPDLKKLMLDFFVNQKPDIFDIRKDKHSNKLINTASSLRIVVKALQKKFDNADNPKKWAHLCHEKYEEAVVEAQEKNPDWGNKSASEKSIIVYKILSKKLLEYLPENVFQIKLPLTNKKMSNIRTKKESCIIILSKIIVYYAMNITEDSAVEKLLNAPMPFPRSNIAQRKKIFREEQFQKLQDNQEKFFLQEVVDFFKNGAQKRYTSYHLSMALAYEKLPENQKTQSSLMKFIAKDAPTLLDTPASQRELPEDWIVMAASIDTNYKRHEKFFLKLILRSDELLRKAVELSHISSSLELTPS